jgi:hypothetical protein
MTYVATVATYYTRRGKEKKEVLFLEREVGTEAATLARGPGYGLRDNRGGSRKDGGSTWKR